MVFFVCDGCGETLKKARVDAHAAKCRSCYSVSCVDCSRSFPGDEYRHHTTCISEAERYEKTVYRGTRKLDASGTGHRQKQVGGEKTTPQEAWIQTIQAAAETAPASLKSYMRQLTLLENVPRKEKQFRNFTVNSLRLKGADGEKVKGEIWTVLMKVREEGRKRKEEEGHKKKQQSRKEAAEKDGELPDSSKKSMPMAASVSDDELPSSRIKASGEGVDFPSEKAVTRAMKKALKKAPNRRLKFKALRKQVQESLSFRADEYGKRKWKRLFEQCIDGNPKRLVLNGKTVLLIA